MPSSKIDYLKNLPRAIVWTVGTTFFALAPLITLYVINLMSEENIARREIQHMFQDGIFLVAACALAGSIVFDFLVTKNPVRSWLISFVIYMLPFLILIILFTHYLFVYIQLGDQHEFGPGAGTTKLILALVVCYCIFVKTVYLSKKE